MLKKVRHVAQTLLHKSPMYSLPPPRYLNVLSAVPYHGGQRVMRQSLFGHRGPCTGQCNWASYAVMGDKQWTSGPITPHPDYFVALLFRQLMGTTVLNLTVSASAPSAVRVYAWCARNPATSGAVVLTYLNTGTDQLSITVAGVGATGPRTEYFLTSPSNALDSDVVLLNGAAMTVDGNGVLPTYPVAGHSNSASGPIEVPPTSVGFIVLEAAGATLCM